MVSAQSVASIAISIQPTPDDGLQPRIVVDQSGAIHLLYFKRRINRPDAREGNLYYRQYLADAQKWGNPVKVSTQAYNLQTVSISRADMAVDGEGRVHVVWYLPREVEYFYTRSDIDRKSFEPQQSIVSQYTEGLDAGAGIAAAGSQVAIVWGAGDLSREYERTVYARMSQDNGASFGPETRVGSPALGACGCCSLATGFTDENDLRVAYRSAIDGVGRHMQLLTQPANTDNPAFYDPVHELQQWQISSCPLSTNQIVLDGAGSQWLVFETAARIVQKNLDSGDVPARVAEPTSNTRQKNPVIAVNGAGQRLIVWGEAISHSRGGTLNMRLFDADDTSLDSGFADAIEIPDFSFPAAATLPGGGFLVLY